MNFLIALTFIVFNVATVYSFAIWPTPKSNNLGFSWSNCGPGSDPLQVQKIDESPDPVHVPGNITIGVTAVISATLPNDIRASITMEKKVGSFYIKVPCVDNVGSCNYGDICGDWAKICPPYFAKYGVPCNCPIPPNTYNIPDTVLDISGNLPSIIDGGFRITADISSGSGHLGCIRLELSLDS